MAFAAVEGSAKRSVPTIRVAFCGTKPDRIDFMRWRYKATA